MKFKEIIYNMMFIPSFFLLMILSFPLWVILQPLKLIVSNSKKESIVWGFLKYWSKLTLFSAGLKINCNTDIPYDSGIIYYSNHQSYLDIYILLSLIPKTFAYVSKDTLLKIPIVGLWIKELGCVPVSREKSRDELKKMKVISERLKSGKSFVIFPESTRSYDGAIGKIFPATFRIPVWSKCNFVIVSIDGSYNVHNRKSMGIKPGIVKVRFSELYDSSGLSSDLIYDLVDSYFHNKINENEIPVKRNAYAEKG